MTLLAHTKIPEYIPEDFVGGYFANDGGEVIQGFAYILGYEVCRGSATDSLSDTNEGGEGRIQSLLVAEV